MLSSETGDRSPEDRVARPGSSPVATVDVVIVGAGISGIAAAHDLTEQCPGLSFIILEAQAGYGGTWRTHRYPGARSDSDLYTYGFRFKPWLRAPIATAEEIQTYLGEVIRDEGLEQKIRYGHSVNAAAWSDADKVWTLQISKDGGSISMRTRFLLMCQGYYRHDAGYTPHWPGMDAFKGRFIHPQDWPDALDLSNEQVVIVGSGATAATLIPALGGQCKRLTMLQRSPTYFTVGRNAVALADELRELKVDENWIHEIVRRRLSTDREKLTRRAREHPQEFREELIGGVKALLSEDFDMRHFSPRYDPWTQRIAFDPEGLLFKTFRSGNADVVTDEIEKFDETGIQLKSGRHLDATVVVTATGFNLSVMGDIAFSVNGRPVDFSKTVSFRGMAFTGVPNMAWVFGYFRASWTLRAHLVNDLFCRLLRHMEAIGARKFEVALRPEEKNMELRPWMEPDDFNPGYLSRSLHLMPKLGTKPEWRISQDYMVEKAQFEATRVDDPLFRYSS